MKMTIFFVGMQLWTIKAILRRFELASGFKVNFLKSCIFCDNVGRTFLEVAESFLHCKVCQLRFKYLQLPVGVSQRKCDT